jgi:hypothetical protein
MEDHIVEEVRRIREEHAAQFDYDVDAIFDDLRRIEAESKRPRVSFGLRKIEKPILSSERLPTVANK